MVKNRMAYDIMFVFNMVIVFVIAMVPLALVFSILAGVIYMIKRQFFGTRGSIYPLAIIGFPVLGFLSLKKKIKERKNYLLPSLFAFLAVFAIGSLMISPIPVRAGMNAVALTATDSNVSVYTGIPKSMTATGLSASTTYTIYIGSELVKVISTSSSETTKTFNIVFLEEGSFNVSIRNEAGDTYSDSLIMYAESPLFLILIIATPLLLGVLALVVIIGGIGLLAKALR